MENSPGRGRAGIAASFLWPLQKHQQGGEGSPAVQLLHCVTLSWPLSLGLQDCNDLPQEKGNGTQTPAHPRGFPDILNSCCFPLFIEHGINSQSPACQRGFVCNTIVLEGEANPGLHCCRFQPSSFPPCTM